MNIEELYNYCLSIPGAEATTPFDDVTLVMKVCDKMFALIPLDAERLCIALNAIRTKRLSYVSKLCGSLPFHMNKPIETITLPANADEEVRDGQASVDEVIKKLPPQETKRVLWIS